MDKKSTKPPISSNKNYLLPPFACDQRILWRILTLPPF